MIWITISILILLIILGIAALLFTKRPHKPDYYALYTIGIVWMIAGIPLKNYALSAIGLILSIIGITHKDEWKKNRKQLAKTERKMIIALTAGLILLVIITLIYLYIRR